MTTNQQNPKAARISTGADQYDHAIALVDSTKPTTPPAVDDASGHPSNSHASIPGPRISIEDGIPIARIWSKAGLNQEFNRRRYARFQEHKYDSGEESDNSKSKGRVNAVLKSLDDRRGRALEKLHIRPRNAGKAKDTQSAVDILYENQRGLFIFGYPLYSSRSLLNFDPAAWTDAQSKDSAVDIRNAQVPDPTWIWSWKRWYVDMSGDVDEQGWQYSLMFGKKFSWHGTHPWFHSAVRRRRWLRKRTKIEHAHHTKDAHDMAQDYFTIHTGRRDSSRESSLASRNIDRSNRNSSRFQPPQDSENDGEIDNVVSLLHVMKNTTVDRKKLDAFRSFIKNGGEELQLLPSLLPEIWKLFLYQNSRRQLLSILEEAEHKLQEQQVSGSGSSSNRSTQLRDTMKLIRDNLESIEYYSDAKAIERDFDDHEAGHKEAEPLKRSPGQDKLDQVEYSREPSKDTNIELTRVSFKGIPKSAGLDIEPGIARPQRTESSITKDSEF